MRDIKTIQDANAVLRDVNNFLDSLRSADWDRHQRRIRNNAPGVLPDDYVTLKQLKDFEPTKIKREEVQESAGGIFYDKVTFGISIDSNLVLGADLCPHVPTQENASLIDAKATLKVASTGGSGTTVDIKLGGVTIFSTPFVIPSGSIVSVAKTDFAISSINKGDILTADVTGLDSGNLGQTLTLVLRFSISSISAG